MKAAQLLAQVEKLEAAVHGRRRRFPYVIRLSDPPTQGELAQMRANATAGKPYAVMPHKCMSADEWMERYAPAAMGDR